MERKIETKHLIFKIGTDFDFQWAKLNFDP